MNNLDRLLMNFRRYLCNPALVAPILWTAAPGLLLFGVTLILSSTARGEDPPSWTSLFPAGGQRGTKVDVKLSGTFPRWPVDIWCDRSDVQVKALSDSGMIELTLDPVTEPGPLQLRLHGPNGATSIRNWIVGTYAETAEKEPNDQLRLSQVIENIPCTINGVLEKNGDSDTFRIKLSKGERLRIAVEANSQIASPLDATVQVLGITGSVLAQNMDYRGLDPQLVFEAPRDGDFLVRLFGMPETPDQSIQLTGQSSYIYRLTIVKSPYAIAPVPFAVANVAPVQPVPKGAGLASFKPSETVPKFGADEESYRVYWEGVDGSFRVPIVTEPIVIESEPTSLEEPQKVALPVCISGQLDIPRDVDVYRWESPKESRWKITLQSRRLGFPTDLSIELQDDQGKSLVQSDDTKEDRDPMIRWKCPADGAYRVVVRDTFSHGGDDYFYLLQVEEEKPELELTVPKDLVQAKAGEAIEVEVSIERSGDIQDEIRVVTEGLPEGATCEPGISAPKGDTSKKVKLSLVSPVPFQGPIRIVGRCNALQDQRRVAKVDKTTHTHLWLSILPAAPKPDSPKTD